MNWLRLQPAKHLRSSKPGNRSFPLAVEWSRFYRQFPWELSVFAAVVFLTALFGCPVSDAQSLPPSNSIADFRHSVVDILCFERSRHSGRRSAVPASHGCGVVISTDGEIVTNRHLLGDLQSSFIQVQLPGGDLAEATVLAANSWSDLAVIKIDRQDMQPVEWTDSQTETKTDDTVWIVPGVQSGVPTCSGTVIPTLQILQVEQTLRFDSCASDSLYQYGKLVRIKTPVNGFTSGAAVVNSRGQFAGLTTALVPDSKTTVDSFAIPVDATFRRVVAVLRTGRLPGFGLLGVTPRDLQGEQLKRVQRHGVMSGVQIVDVALNAPADIAGIEFSDVITSVNQVAIRDSDHLLSLLSGSLAGSTIDVSVLRGVLKNQPVELINLRVTLSRKYLPTRRASYQSQPVVNWRGLQVEYPTAIARFESLARMIDPEGCVVVSTVELDSIAWNAGLRPRVIVRMVNKQQVHNPAEFYRLVNLHPSKSVELTMFDEETNEPVTITVASR